MSVTLREWAVDTGGPSLRAGKVKITVSNAGMMPHNLTITDSSGQILGATPNFRSSDGAQILA